MTYLFKERFFMTKAIVNILPLLLFLGFFAVTAPGFADEAPAAPAKAETKKASPNQDVGIHVTLKAPLMQPLFSTFPVAIVNGETITLGTLNETVASAHEERVETAMQQRIDFAEILKRLINTRLIIQEARNMELDELPEIKEMVDVFTRQTLRDHLLEDKTKDVKPDPVEVEKLYKELAKEWKIRSVLFEKEEDAQKMLEQAKSGKDFDALVDEAVKSNKAKGGEAAALVKPKDMLPQIAAVVAAIKAGDLSPVIKLEPKKNETGYAVFKLLAIEYPDNAAAREQAEREVLGRKRTAILRQFAQSLLKKYGKLKWPTINALDYNAKKGAIDKLLKDKRAVATIKAEKPITVAELTAAVKEKYYHGIERAVEEKKVNEEKVPTLLGLLEKRLLRKEALRLGIDKRDDYRKAIADYKDSLLFGAFVQKAVIPDVKIDNADLHAYYNDHQKDFSSPEMIRMRDLVFTMKEQAEDAVAKLRKGTDFNWLMSNAEGQVDKSTEGLLAFEGKLLTLTSLPEGVREAVAGAKAGDVRYYGSAEGHYALLVQQVVPPNLQPLEQVKGDIAKKLHEQKLKEAVEDWAKKLKESGEVKVYLMPSSDI